jgi:hypothetical protein
MDDSQKDNFKIWTNDEHMAARYAPIHGMLTELLASTDPDGSAIMLESLLEQYKPQSIGERHMLALMADLSWRIHGCFYLENEILNRGLQACGSSKDAPGQALARVYMREIKRGGLLSKLSSYENRLAREFSRCLRIIELAAKNRKFAAAMIAAKEARMAAALAKRKPCTSVIQ